MQYILYTGIDAMHYAMHSSRGVPKDLVCWCAGHHEISPIVTCEACSVECNFLLIFVFVIMIMYLY